MKIGIEKTSEIFKAMGDPTRLRLIRLLASNMEDRLCVVDLAQKLHISQPAASQHLKVLKNAEILFSKREGNRVFYYIDGESLKTQFEGILKIAFSKCVFDGDCKNCPIYDDCEFRETIV